MIWQKRWVQNTALAVLAAIGVYALIYADVVSRAKESYNEGEKYMAWHKDPSLKVKAFEAIYAAKKAKIDEDLSRKKISDQDYQSKLETLEFEKKYNIDESSLKYAYQWYKDTYELFSPPESKWVKAARAKAPEALEMWKQELRDKKIPFEDYMLE